MKQAMRSVCVAASMIMLAGSAPALAGPAGKGGGPDSAQKIGAGHNRAAKKAHDRMHRDLNRLAARLAADMRDAVQPSFDAMSDLAGAEPSDEDLDALMAGFAQMLSDAEAAAMASFNEVATKRLEDLKSRGASERLMAKAQVVVKRLQRRLENRAESLENRFEDRMSEMFVHYVLPDEKECEHDDDDPIPPVPMPEPTPDPAPSGG